MEKCLIGKEAIGAKWKELEKLVTDTLAEDKLIGIECSIDDYDNYYDLDDDDD